MQKSRSSLGSALGASLLLSALGVLALLALDGEAILAGSGALAFDWAHPALGWAALGSGVVCFIEGAALRAEWSTACQGRYAGGPLDPSQRAAIKGEHAQRAQRLAVATRWALASYVVVVSLALVHSLRGGLPWSGTVSQVLSVAVLGLMVLVARRLKHDLASGALPG